MLEYTIPIKTAVITFPFAAALFTVPFLLFQYRKHGYINYFRAFLLYSFLLYLLAAYYLVILPLPKSRDVLSMQKPGTKYVQLVPFKFVLDILKETKVHLSRPSTYLHLFKERAFLQVAFNAILLLPLGVYLRYYFKKDIKRTVIISFLVSLFFELTQLSALYGIYNRPYRIFDVDDLMMNTLGGYLGYMISPLFTKPLPNVNKLDDKIDLENITVSFIRRFLAFALDWFIFIALSIVTREHLAAYIFALLYFLFITYFTNGKTFGKWVLRIKVIGKGEKLKFKEVLIRYGILYYVFFGMNYLVFTSKFVSNIMFVILISLVDFAGFLDVTIHMLSKDKRLYYEKVSGTRLKVIK